MEYSREYLKNNPVFWSRLGFCYDPPLKNAEGKPLVFTENLEKFSASHRSFSHAGVKIHTCILHSGWMGIDEYDYSLTDRVLDEVFKDNEDAYYIPRIKLNVPVEWCREYPEEVFVYENGPTDREEIRALVGTLQHDYIGYDSPFGYYQAGDYVDPRPNVGGLISLQSFSSKKWLEDAGVALEKLLDRLEQGKYGSRILGYHIAFGTSGESVMWGRISHRYGDYGITNRREFYQWGLKKYRTQEALEAAWCKKELTPDTLMLPSRQMRTGKTDDLQEFMRGRPADRISIDYDSFISEVNVEAIEHFGKIVKEKTGKLTGCFYGYFVHVDNAGYAGHLEIEKLLNSPYIDFLAAPKSYYRCAPGEPGGELLPAQSINRKKIWLDELDNRTYLAVPEVVPENTKKETEMDISGWFSKSVSESITVLHREFSKNLAHDSGFWWMDLGGGWYDSKELMDSVEDCVEINAQLRQRKHESVSDVLIVVDENSARYMRESKDLRCGFMEDFIMETAMSGALADIYRMQDLEEMDLSAYKLIVFAYTVYMEPEWFEQICRKISDDTTIMFQYAAGAWNRAGFSLEHSEKITGYQLTEAENPNGYDFPQLKPADPRKKIEKRILNTTPYMKHDKIREIAQNAGCHIYTDREGITLYGDNRFLGVFNKDECTLELRLKESGPWREVTKGQVYENTGKIEVSMPEKSVLIFVRE